MYKVWHIKANAENDFRFRLQNYCFFFDMTKFWTLTNANTNSLSVNKLVFGRL